MNERMSMIFFFLNTSGPQIQFSPIQIQENENENEIRDEVHTCICFR